MLIEIVKSASMHFSRGMKSTEDFTAVTGKCCNWQPFLTTFKFTNLTPRWASLVIVIRSWYVKQAELLITWNALFCCHNFAFFLLALMIAWSCLTFCQILCPLLFFVFLRRHLSCLKGRGELTHYRSIAIDQFVFVLLIFLKKIYFYLFWQIYFLPKLYPGKIINLSILLMTTFPVRLIIAVQLTYTDSCLQWMTRNNNKQTIAI